MSQTVEWDDILIQAGDTAAKLVPGIPGAIIGIATGIAKAIQASGCEISGCPADVDLKPADLPDVAREFREAEQAAHERARTSRR